MKNAGYVSLRKSRKAALISSFVALLVCAAYALSGGWSAPASLSTPIPPTFYTTTPAVGINSSGAQAAAWVNESNYLLLQVAARDAGGNWSQAQTLTPASGWNAAEPAVAVGPAGNAVAIWDIYQVNPPKQLLVQASVRNAHGAWGPVVTVSATGGSVPQIAIDANGNAIAIWTQNGVIDSATLPAGGAWSAPVALSGTTASSPTLAVNAKGDAVAGWKTSNGAIFVAERKSGAWTAPTMIAPPAFRAGGPHVALNGLGMRLSRGVAEARRSSQRDQRMDLGVRPRLSPLRAQASPLESHSTMPVMLSRSSL